MLLVKKQCDMTLRVPSDRFSKNLLTCPGIIHSSIPEVSSRVKNSFYLINKLNELCFEPDYVLASLNVISLFTNIPIDLVTKSIERRWDYIAKKNWNTVK